MKKFSVIILLAILGMGVANAQRKATVSGVVADADTRQTIIGAVVSMTPVSDSTKITSLVSGAGGAFSTGLTQGDYRFTVSILGYETLHKAVSVNASRVSVDTLYLSQGIVIEDIVKTAVAMRTSTKGDTIIYNADSYKVASDADVSGMLSKMPGIKVENGTVEAQGETVKKILIDGREFFGEDVNAAITALPAEAVKSIEVFDKLSDNAEFTGIDDGEGYKAINIRTRESMRQGVMGQVSGLVGVEPAEKGETKSNLYGSAKGNVSIFQGDAKITLGGTLNNLNQRNFTADDFLGFGGGNGLGTVGVFQANYIDTWGKKNQWEVDATYRFNATDSENTEEKEIEYFDSSFVYPYVNSTNVSNRGNNNHVFRARIDFKPNKFQELRLRPFVRYQGNSGHNVGDEWYYTSSDFLNDQSIHYSPWSDSRSTGLRAGMDMNYRVRLGKPGRTLTTRLNVGYNTDTRFSESFSQNFVQDQIVSLRRKTPSDNYGYNLQGGVIYTEPVSKTSLITLDYNFSYQYSDIDRKRYEWDETLNDYQSDYNTVGSGIYNSDYWTHRIGPGYRMQKGETTVSAGVFFQYSTLSSESIAPVMEPIKTQYYNPTYSLMITSKFGEGASLRVFFNSNTNPPSVESLQDVVNLSNEQNISIGDPNLKPAYNHRLFARFILPNVTAGRTFSLNFSGNYTQNYVGNMTIRGAGYEINNSKGEYQYTLTSPTQAFSKPVNLEGSWQVRGGVDYGFPLTFIKSNLNLRAGASYAETPSMTGVYDGNSSFNITETLNNSRNMGVNGGLTLGSNISEKVDFMISYNISYNNVINSAFSQANNSYLRHMVMGNFKFVLPADFTLAGDAFYTNYNSLKGNAFDQQYVLVNASIGKKIFRDKSGEISLFCNDIANQNTSFQRQWNAQNMTNVTNTVIGRYFGIKLSWNIRKFGKNGSRNMDMYQMPGNGFGPGGFGGGRPPRF
jgi:uncharacterized membrane protein